MTEARNSAPADHPSSSNGEASTVNGNGGDGQSAKRGDRPAGQPGSTSSPLMASTSFQHVNDDRSSRSSSPAVRRTGRTTSGANGNRLADESDLRHAELDQNPFDISAEEASLERQELQQFKTRASASSSTVLPPAPSLPYDLGYSPLSPMGVDQIGHSLASRFPLQAAQLTGGANRKVNGTGSAAGNTIGQFAGTSTARPTSHHEKPKKPLPGQELEHHMVSDSTDGTLPGQRPMPWGLQTTLIDRARDSPPHRTKMGTLKRIAPHESKSRFANVIKAEDDTASEHSTPQFATIELEQTEDLAAEDQESKADTGDQSYLQGRLKQSRDLGNDESRDVHSDDSDVDKVAAEIANGDKSVVDVSTSLAETSIAASAGIVPTVVKKRRRKASTHEIDRLRLDIGNGSTAETDVGDVTTDSTGSRRPRAAHKRLKMIGGYYGRNPKAVIADEADDNADLSASAAEESNVHDAGLDVNLANGHSRATSSIPEGEARAQSIAAEELETAALSSAAAPPTTPLKPSQPSLSMGLRQSATKSQSGKMVHAGAGLIDSGEGNNEYCDTCQGIGHFICCDGCPRSFHFACINPPLDIDELPKTIGDTEDKWYCNVCKSERFGKGGAGGSKKGRKMLAPLITFIDSHNPSVFSLPLDVRNYFKGVATATDGSYVDSAMLRPLKIGKFGLVDERDPYKLKDKNGKAVLCYRCGKSALPPPPPEPEVQRNGNRRSSPRKSSSLAPQQSSSAQPSSSASKEVDRTGWLRILGCDFCSLHWHLDCLEPPLATMPSLSRKWMCPNHIEHARRPERVPKSVANSTSIHDLPLPSTKSVGVGKHYRTRVVNDGLIDIIPDPLDTYFGSSSSSVNGAHARQDAKAALAGSSTTSSNNENRGRGLDKGWEEQDIPSTTLYELPSNNGRSNAATTLSSNVNANLKFKYRVPEKVIRLDFWHRAEMERERALASCLHRIEQRSRFKLDTLASIADAALSARATPEEGKKLSDREAALLAERLFGSQMMRNLYPDPEVALNDEDVTDAGDSCVRQTFKPGEYEVEFNARALASVAAASEYNVKAAEDVVEAQKKAVAVRTAETMRARDESLASQLHVEAAEVAQLRAVQAMMQRRGPQAVLDFLMHEQT